MTDSDKLHHMIQLEAGDVPFAVFEMVLYIDEEGDTCRTYSFQGDVSCSEIARHLDQVKFVYQMQEYKANHDG